MSKQALPIVDQAGTGGSDGAGQGVERVRRVRDEIDAHVRTLLSGLVPAPADRA